jgi:hypothetical protein
VRRLNQQFERSAVSPNRPCLLLPCLHLECAIKGGGNEWTRTSRGQHLRGAPRGLHSDRSAINAAYRSLRVDPKRVGHAGMDATQPRGSDTPQTSRALWHLPRACWRGRGMAEGARCDKPRSRVARKMFAALGNHPDDASYLSLSPDEVCSFLDEVTRWIMDPERQRVDP